MNNRKPFLYVICIKNDDYPASLEKLKIYRVIPDEKAAQYNQIRVIDESGEDYLYSADHFAPIELPENVQELIGEYDFSKGERGKYAGRYAEGTNIVLLNPDVAEVFTDSKLVNDVLRAIIKLENIEDIKELLEINLEDEELVPWEQAKRELSIEEEQI